MATHHRSHEDGARLVAALEHLADEHPYVLAIPRGGVLLGERVARALAAPFDVLVAGKVYADDALAFAGLAEGGALVVDEALVAAIGLPRAELDLRIDRERERQDAMLEHIRGSWPLPELAGRTVILVDDAMITGLTMRAAIACVRARGARPIIAAAPLGSSDETAVLAAGAHEVVLLSTFPPGVAARVHEDDRDKPCPPLGDAEIHDLIARELHDVGVDPFAGLAIDGI